MRGSAQFRDLVQSALAKIGYELRALPVLLTAGGMPNETVAPRATYAPWRVDREFQMVFQAIRSNTLVDIYRCYELWQLAAEASKLPAGSILEIGVWRGGTTALLARRFAMQGVEEPMFACDTFQGVVGAGTEDNWYRGGEHSDTSIGVVLSMLKRLALQNVRVLPGVFPQSTGHLIDHQHFRLCHIDVDVYRSAKDTVEWVWPKMVPGGIVVFDDYGFSFCEGITRLVDEYRARGDRLVIHNLNGHALLVKL